MSRHYDGKSNLSPDAMKWNPGETTILDFALLHPGYEIHRGYQTLINEELKHSMKQQSLERTLRKVVRDELKKRAA